MGLLSELIIGVPLYAGAAATFKGGTQHVRMLVSSCLQSNSLNFQLGAKAALSAAE